MSAAIDTVTQWLSSSPAKMYVKALLILVGGLILARVVYRRLAFDRLQPQHRFIVSRLASYFIVACTIVLVLKTLGLDLSVLLGAAGILTVAIGFAAQTSASNLISGLFLMGERPFVIGDVIRVGETVGEVVAIDLLSVKLKTFDNLQVRIPNESMLKSNVTNMTHYPIRRYDLRVGVAYKEDLSRVRDILLNVADNNPICLEEPKPLVIFLEFGASSVDMQFSVWAAKGNYLALRNTISAEVKQAFDQEGIEIPFPHRTLYTGSQTAPLPIEVSREENPSNC